MPLYVYVHIYLQLKTRKVAASVNVRSWTSIPLVCQPVVGNVELRGSPWRGAIVVNVAKHALRQYFASLDRVLSQLVVGEGAVLFDSELRSTIKKCLSSKLRKYDCKDGGRQPRERHEQRRRSRDRVDHQGEFILRVERRRGRRKR